MRAKKAAVQNSAHQKAERDKSIDAQAGAGSAAIKNQTAHGLLSGEMTGGEPHKFDDNPSSPNSLENFNDAFSGSMIQTAQAGGEGAKSEFVSKFNESAADGFSSYGGSPRKAASSIGNSVATSAMESKVAPFGSSAKAAMSKVASNSDGTLNVPKANKFARQVGEMAQGYAAQGNNSQSVSNQIQADLTEVADNKDDPVKKFKNLYDGATRTS